MSDFIEDHSPFLSPLCKRGAGGICLVRAENLKSPSFPLFQRGKSRVRVVLKYININKEML
jgi:hypothetical protein